MLKTTKCLNDMEISSCRVPHYKLMGNCVIPNELNKLVQFQLRPATCQSTALRIFKALLTKLIFSPLVQV